MVIFESELIDDLQYFIVEYRHLFPVNLLPKNNLTSPDETVTIVTNANQGIKENGLDRLKDVRNYLIDLEKDLSEYYGFDDDYYEQEEMIEILKSLIKNLDPKRFAKTHNIITPGESMALQSMARQKRLPSDMEMEIQQFVGKPPIGGRKKKRTQKKQKRATKSRRKRSTYKRRR